MDLDAMEVRLRRVEEALGLRPAAPHAAHAGHGRHVDHATMHFRGAGRTAPAVEPFPWKPLPHEPMSDEVALARAHGLSKALAKVHAPKVEPHRHRPRH